MSLLESHFEQMTDGLSVAVVSEVMMSVNFNEQIHHNTVYDGIYCHLNVCFQVLNDEG